jgi:Cu(I)/Ag(I) efflux system membrane fusion protein
VPVTLGEERGDRTAVLSGLEEGQQVVTSGQFLIDSEASLRGAFNRLDREQP